MHIETSRFELNIPNIFVVLLLSLVGLIGFAYKRYDDNKNYDWTGIYAVKHCEKPEESECLIVITKSRYQFNINDLEIEATMYRPVVGIWDKYLISIDDLRKPESKKNPEKFNTYFVEKTANNAEQIALRHRDQIFYKVNSETYKNFSDYISKHEKTESMFSVIKEFQNKYASSLYKMLPSAIWKTRDGATLYLNNSPVQFCSQPQLCVEMLLTKGNLSQTLLVSSLQIAEEHTFDRKLILHPQNCDNTPIKDITFTFNFNKYYKPESLTLNIRGKERQYQLIDIDGKPPQIRFSLKEKELMEADSQFYDGCNYWKMP